MATSDKLKLEAEVVDNATGPLRKISRELKLVAGQRVDNLGRQFDSVQRKLAPLEGGISGIGLSIARLAGPIGAVATAVGGGLYFALKKMNEGARGIRTLHEFSRLTGFSAVQVEKFSQAMERLDVTREQAQAGLATFGGNLFKLRTHTAADLRDALGRGGAPLLDQIEKLASVGKNDEALTTAIEGITKLEKSDPMAAADLTVKLFGDAALYRVYKYNEELKKMGPITVGNAKDAQKLIDKANDLDEALKRAGKTALNKGLGATGSAIDLISPDKKTPELNSAEDQLARINRRLGTIDPSSAKFKALSAEREELLKEIEKLKKGIRELSDNVAPLAKKMSFVGMGVEDGGGITNASFVTGGSRGGGGGIGYRYGGAGGSPMGSAGGLSGSDTGTPSGSGGGIAGAGGKGGAGGIATARSAIMDQLRKEGVPEANLKHAASALTGQALSESGLNPNLSHDGGTGYGIYGARNERAKGMLSWLSKNGYAKNSLEGQAKYMAHEAMTAFPQSRAALMEANAQNMGGVNRTLTRDFERPAVNNYGDRMANTMRAYNASDDNGGPVAGVNELQGKVAGIRKGALAAQLKEQLAFASSQTGLVAEITSGGQRMPGAPGATGSHRHDHGGAGDLRLRDPETGQLLDMRDPKDQARMASFTKAAVRAGARGVGAGLGYMGPNTIHIGGGKTAAWGGASWVQGALQGGLAEKPVDMNAWRAQMDKAQSNEMNAKVEGSGKITVDVNGPKGTKVGAEGGGLFKDVQINRSTQMLPASRGPAEDFAAHMK